jgi:hypothetical protein
LVVNYENLYFISLDDTATMDAQAFFWFLGGQLGRYVVFLGLVTLATRCMSIDN